MEMNAETRLEELIQKISEDEKYARGIFEASSIFFAIKDGRILTIPSDAGYNPRCSWFPPVVTGPSAEEKAYLANIMAEIGFDDEFFREYLYDCDEYDDEAVREYFEENADEDSLEIYEKIFARFTNDSGPFATMDDMISALVRYYLDDDLYYEFEGDFINFYENICFAGEEIGTYEHKDASEWIEILENIDDHVVTCD